MRVTERRKKECIDHLKGILVPGDTIYTKLDHVSRSGMYRVISLYVIKDNEPVWLTRPAADLLEGYDERHQGAKASGCGMDMGFHLVNTLGYILFPEGFGCIGEKCPSNDHHNGDRDYTIFGSMEQWENENGELVKPCTHWHKSGGYAFRQKWL